MCKSQYYLPMDNHNPKYESEAFDIHVKSGADYEITDSHIIVKNVPITGEIVQEYQDGTAYKPLDEIKKIDVLNSPITFMHPSKQTEDMTVEEITENQVGFLRPASDKPKHEKKLYSDLVLPRTERTKDLEDKLVNNEAVDVSIGFKFEMEKKSGTFLGKAFDYIQKNIKIDHLAILLDQFGKTHPGRAPAPYYGIGADDLNTNKKMSSDTNLQLEKDHALLEKDHSVLKGENDSLKSQVASDAQEIKDLKADIVAKDEKLKSAEDELKVFKDAEKSAVDSMREDLSKKMPNMKKVFDSADSDSIKDAHAEMLKNSASVIDGGEGEEQSSDMDDLNNQFRSVKKEATE